MICLWSVNLFIKLSFCMGDWSAHSSQKGGLLEVTCFCTKIHSVWVGLLQSNKMAGWGNIVSWGVWQICLTSGMEKPSDSPIGQENHLRYLFYCTMVTLAYFYGIFSWIHVRLTLSNLWITLCLVNFHLFLFLSIYGYLSMLILPFMQMFGYLTEI